MMKTILSVAIVLLSFVSKAADTLRFKHSIGLDIGRTVSTTGYFIRPEISYKREINRHFFAQATTGYQKIFTSNNNLLAYQGGVRNCKVEGGFLMLGLGWNIYVKETIAPFFRGLNNRFKTRQKLRGFLAVHYYSTYFNQYLNIQASGPLVTPVVLNFNTTKFHHGLNFEANKLLYLSPNQHLRINFGTSLGFLFNGVDHYSSISNIPGNRLFQWRFTGRIGNVSLFYRL